MTRDEKILDFLNNLLRSTTSAIELFDAPEPPQPPTNMWAQFIRAVVLNINIPNNAKLVCVAQAIQETGRGKSDLFKLHNNAHGMKFRDELKGFAVPIKYYTDSEPTGVGVFCKFATIEDGVDGYLRFLNRSPYEGWEQHASNPVALIKHIGKTWAADPNYVYAVLEHFAEAKRLLESAGWVMEKIPPTGLKPLDGLTVILDPGHSRSAQGASSMDRSFTEYAMNMVQAKHLNEYLTDLGASVEIYDPDPDSLSGVGRKAKGKKLYISLHHNAANRDGRDEGTETFISRNADYTCERFAKKVNDAIVAALGSRNRGVKRKDYTVIATATSVGCPYAILTESYFIDDYSNINTATTRSLKAAQAIGETVLEWFR